MPRHSRSPQQGQQISTSVPASVPLECTRPPWRIRPGWQERRVRNSRTAVGRLPDEILLMIMKEVEQDPLDLYVLRQTCRVFARLFEDSSFCQFHEYEWSSSTKKPLKPWRTSNRQGVDKRGNQVTRFLADVRAGKEEYFKYPFPNSEQGRDKLFRRLSLPDLCTECQSKRTSARAEQKEAREGKILQRSPSQIHCHGCGTQHTDMAFSARQRALRLSTVSRPVCIVHEGSVRLCPHDSIKYQQLRKWVQAGNFKNQVVWECQDCSKDLGPSELPSSVSISRDGTHHPRIVVSVGSDDSGKEQRLLKTWELPIFKVSPLAESGIPEAMAINGLEAAQLRYGDLACPHLRFNDGQLLRELECGNSSCLGSSCLRKEVGNKNGKKGQSYAKCQAAIAAIQLIYPLHEHRDNCACESPWEERLKWVYAHRYGQGSPMIWRKYLNKYEAHYRAYKAVLPWVSHRVCCELCNAEYRWIRRGNLFWVSFRQKFPSCRTMPYTCDSKHKYDGNSVNLIDPASYGHEEDAEFKHVTWCPDSSCGNWKRGPIRHSNLRWATEKNKFYSECC
ncbi:hypothetical protein V8F06_005712 [Rhypophila decipiens]